MCKPCGESGLLIRATIGAERIAVREFVCLNPVCVSHVDFA